MEKIQNDIIDMAKKAVDDGKSYLKNLDFSEKSLSDVEEILELYHLDLKGNIIKNFIRKIKKQMPTENQIWSMAMMYGAYIGEVIRKNTSKEVVWVYEAALGSGELLHLKLDDNNRINPIGKVFKRLKNGKEDEILFFYEVFKKQML